MDRSQRGATGLIALHLFRRKVSATNGGLQPVEVVGLAIPQPILYALLEGFVAWLHYAAAFTTYAAFVGLQMNLTFFGFASFVAWGFGFGEFLLSYYKLPEPAGHQN